MMEIDDQERRERFIQGLRALADFYDARPNLPAPHSETMNVFVDTKDEIITIARMAAWEKVYTPSWFSLRREFGPVAIEINVSRNVVCKRVVTGTETIPAQPAQPERTVEKVEWVCDEPLLQPEETTP